MLSFRRLFQFYLSLSYHGDEILVHPLHWLWYLFRQPPRSSWSFFSCAYGEYFNHFSEYWQMVGRKNALVEVLQRKKNLQLVGCNQEEVLAYYTRAKYSHAPVVVMTEISLEQVPRLLEKLTSLTIKDFVHDFLFIPCKSREDAFKLVDAIPYRLAVTYAFHDGLVIRENMEPYGN